SLTSRFGDRLDGFASPTFLATYLHQHLGGDATPAERFVRSCARRTRRPHHTDLTCTNRPSATTVDATGDTVTALVVAAKSGGSPALSRNCEPVRTRAVGEPGRLRDEIESKLSRLERFGSRVA